MSFFATHLHNSLGLWAPQVGLLKLDFAMLYATLIDHLLPGAPLVRSLIFTGVLYLVDQCFSVPVFMRSGFFGIKSKEPIYFTMIIVYGEFGLVLGWISPVLGLTD